MTGGIEMHINFGGLLGVLGAGTAMARTVSKNARYMDFLNDVAIGVNIDYFNKVVGPAAGQTGKIKHMFEWGTVGVLPARSGPRMQPTNPRSQLWQHVVTGYGFDKEINYVFKPSVTKRPLPTTGETGMSQTVIRKMHQSTWTWKARTMEEGGVVHISRKGGGGAGEGKRRFLLLPNWEGTDTTRWRKSDIKRGYRLLQFPTTMSIGKNTQGQFEEVFDAYWLSGEASAKIDTTVQKQIEQDFFPFLVVNRGSSIETAAALKLDVTGKVAQASKYVEQVAVRNAMQRAKAFKEAK